MCSVLTTVRPILMAGISLMLLNSQTWSAVIRVDTTQDGNKLDLVAIELTSMTGTGFPNRVIPFSALIPTTVSDYVSVPENNAANTITVLGTPDTVAPSGNDRLLLLGDAHLNTGIFNPSGNTPGIQVQFAWPVVNGPGEDFAVFELTIGAGQTPDPMLIRQVGGVGTARSVLSSHYQRSGLIPEEARPNTFLSTVENNGTTDLGELTTASLTAGGAVTNPKWNVVPIDLSWLGVPLWGSVESLEILSGDATRAVDPLMVMGLPTANSPGDYDADSDVDETDYTIWRQQFGAIGIAAADGNGDGVVNASDYVVWRKHLDDPTVSNNLSVPEPSAWSALGYGAAVLLFLFPRRQTPGGRHRILTS